MLVKTGRFFCLFVCVLWAAIAWAQASDTDAAKAELDRWRSAYEWVERKAEGASLSPFAERSRIAIAVRLATVTMNSPVLTPQEKYPEALRLYRFVLDRAPAHPEALQNKQMIEAIYKSMNRPIPGT